MANAYHLAIRPGADVVAALGGLHRFAAWDGVYMTDSGGFQVFSLAHQRQVDDAGVTFRDPLDGRVHRFTPAGVVAVQEALGADIAFVLDVCTPYPAARDEAERDAARTACWAREAVAARRDPTQAVFGVAQGGVYPDLRARAAEDLAGLELDGYGIGGVSVGEPKHTMTAAVEASVAGLAADKPRHLLGVGYPEDIVEAVALGIDTFDCVMPTRVARNGAALVTGGRLNLRNAEFARDDRPIDPACPCAACRSFSRGAIRHWLKAGEILPLTLLSIHNLHALVDLTRRIRASILAGSFAALRAAAAAARAEPHPHATAA
jgi:queuine tRNA-ribosyltransferase